ncbi:MAG: cell division protein FtsX, partial [Pseudomonadota bacterium]
MSKPAVPMIGRDPYLPSGGVGRLTILTAAIMVFLCVFAVALSGALLRMSERWNDDLAQTATIRLPFADADTLQQQTTAIRDALTQTQGVAGSEVLSEDATKAVLTEWIGEDINLDTVPLPTLIQVKLGSEDLDVGALQAQLSAVAPSAYFDDHSRWRGPLSLSVTILRVIALAGVVMLFTALGVLIWLSLKTSLASNSRVISVLRQLGADDKDIERGFLSRYVG